VSQQPHRCPDCGLGFGDPSALVDHALTAHVAAVTPAAHVRRPKSVWTGRITAALAGLAGVSLIVLMVLLAAGVFDKEGAPEQPRSEAHRMAVELRETGQIDEYRSVEADDGWDAEYELDGDDGVIRTRGTRDDEEIEYETYLDDDLERAIEKVARRHGFDLED
jgi:hypothetical protein